MKRLFASAVALLLILLPSPARADPEPEPFHMAPCVQASLAGVTYDAASNSMVLNGVATQCAPVVEHGGFWLALYLPRSLIGTSYAWQGRRFEGPVEGEVRPFAIRLREASRSTYGVCLLSAMQTPQELGGHRVACGRVVQPNPQTMPPTATLELLPTNDPLFNNKMVLPYPDPPPEGPNGEPDGICPTCF
jgi:hypothetical protein